MQLYRKRLICVCVCVFYNLNEIYITKIDLFLKKYSEYSLNELIF